MASTRLYRTNGTPTNDKIFTVHWIKLYSTSGHVIFVIPGVVINWKLDTSKI